MQYFYFFFSIINAVIKLNAQITRYEQYGIFNDGVIDEIVEYKLEVFNLNQ